MNDSPKIKAEWTEAAIVTIEELGDPEEAQAWALARLESAAPAAPDRPWKWTATKTTGRPGHWIIEFIAYPDSDEHLANIPHIPNGHFEEEPIPAPCPHCGNAWSKVLYEDKPNSIERVYFVRCERCGAQGPEKVASQYNFRECEEQLKHAIREWNRRCQVCALNKHKRQAPLQIRLSAAKNDHFYLPNAPVVLAPLIWRIYHIDRNTGKVICEAVNGTSTYRPKIVLPPDTLVEPINAQAYSRATNIDELDDEPGIRPDADDTSLYHMQTAYADIQLSDYIVSIDASYPDKLILGLHEWSGDVATCRFETAIPIYDENAP